eukprot:28997-Eustigmatos_ZCMA.PRE.1
MSTFGRRQCHIPPLLQAGTQVDGFNHLNGSSSCMGPSVLGLKNHTDSREIPRLCEQEKVTCTMRRSHRPAMAYVVV